MSHFRSSLSRRGLRPSRRRWQPEELESRRLLVCPGGSTIVPAGLIPAQTYLSGDYCWVNTGQPYQLVGDTVVGSGARLFIDPNVNVESFDPETEIRTANSGVLNVLGARLAVDVELDSSGAHSVIGSLVDDATINVVRKTPVPVINSNNFTSPQPIVAPVAFFDHYRTSGWFNQFAFDSEFGLLEGTIDQPRTLVMLDGVSRYYLTGETVIDNGGDLNFDPGLTLAAHSKTQVDSDQLTTFLQVGGPNIGGRIFAPVLQIEAPIILAPGGTGAIVSSFVDGIDGSLTFKLGTNVNISNNLYGGQTPLFLHPDLVPNVLPSDPSVYGSQAEIGITAGELGDTDNFWPNVFGVPYRLHGVVEVKGGGILQVGQGVQLLDGGGAIHVGSFTPSGPAAGFSAGDIVVDTELRFFQSSDVNLVDSDVTGTIIVEEGASPTINQNNFLDSDSLQVHASYAVELANFTNTFTTGMRLGILAGELNPLLSGNSIVWVPIPGIERYELLGELRIDQRQLVVAPNVIVGPSSHPQAGIVVSSRLRGADLQMDQAELHDNLAFNPQASASITQSTLQGSEISIHSSTSVNWAGNHLLDVQVRAVGDPGATIPMQFQYWGTTDPQEVEDRIWHNVDSPALPLVDFLPLELCSQYVLAGNIGAVTYPAGERVCWADNGQPYNLTSGDVQVAGGAVLTILPGVQVIGADPSYDVIAQTGGELNVEGAQSSVGLRWRVGSAGRLISSFVDQAQILLSLDAETVVDDVTFSSNRPIRANVNYMAEHPLPANLSFQSPDSFVEVIGVRLDSGNQLTLQQLGANHAGYELQNTVEVAAGAELTGDSGVEIRDSGAVDIELVVNGVFEVFDGVLDTRVNLEPGGELGVFNSQLPSGLELDDLGQRMEILGSTFQAPLVLGIDPSAGISPIDRVQSNNFFGERPVEVSPAAIELLDNTSNSFNDPQAAIVIMEGSLSGNTTLNSPLAWSLDGALTLLQGAGFFVDPSVGALLAENDSGRVVVGADGTPGVFRVDGTTLGAGVDLFSPGIVGITNSQIVRSLQFDSFGQELRLTGNTFLDPFMLFPQPNEIYDSQVHDFDGNILSGETPVLLTPVAMQLINDGNNTLLEANGRYVVTDGQLLSNTVLDNPNAPFSVSGTVSIEDTGTLNVFSVELLAENVDSVVQVGAMGNGGAFTANGATLGVAIEQFDTGAVSVQSSDVFGSIVLHEAGPPANLQGNAFHYDDPMAIDPVMLRCDDHSSYNGAFPPPNITGNEFRGEAPFRGSPVCAGEVFNPLNNNLFDVGSRADLTGTMRDDTFLPNRGVVYSFATDVFVEAVLEFEPGVVAGISPTDLNGPTPRLIVNPTSQDGELLADGVTLEVPIEARAYAVVNARGSVLMDLIIDSQAIIDFTGSEILGHVTAEGDPNQVIVMENVKWGVTNPEVTKITDQGDDSFRPPIDYCPVEDKDVEGVLVSTPGMLVPGQQFSVNYTIRNNVCSTTPPVTASFYLSLDGTIVDEVILDAVPFPQTPPDLPRQLGEYDQFNGVATFQLPSFGADYYGTRLPGNFKIVMFVDPEDVVTPELDYLEGRINNYAKSGYFAIEDGVGSYDHVDGTGDLVLRRNGTNVQLVDEVGSVLLDKELDRTYRVDVRGLRNTTKVTVDYAAGGYFSLPAGVHIDGDQAPLFRVHAAGDTFVTLTQSEPGAGEEPAMGTSRLDVINGAVASQVYIANFDNLEFKDLAALTLTNQVAVHDNQLHVISPRQRVDMAQETTIEGGVIEVTGGQPRIGLGDNDALVGFGQVNAEVSATLGSLIRAEGGDLHLGQAGSFDGFSSNGNLEVQQYHVELQDANEAVLGSLTTIGNAPLGAPGDLRADNGFLLPLGSTLSGFGQVFNQSGTFVNQGTVVGDGPAPLFFEDPVAGDGNYFGSIVFVNQFSPGKRAGESALIHFYDAVEFKENHEMIIELGGDGDAGNGMPQEFDKLIVENHAQLAGTLDVRLINGFQPNEGDTFEILKTTLGSVNGSFSTYEGFDLGAGLRLEPELTNDSVVLRVVAVPSGEIQARQLFYANSSFAGSGASAAIAVDKQPLLPGQGPATFQNYSSYVHGINGVAIDIAGLPAGVTLNPVDDFAFAIGNDSSPANWTPLSDLPTIDVLEGEGLNGSDRVTLTWPDGTIVGKWLEVRVRDTIRTGIPQEDVFYFGSAPGESSGDDDQSTMVDATDFLNVRANPANFLNPASITNRFDFNRDSRVNAADLAIVRDHATLLGELLAMIDVPTNLSAKSPQVRISDSALSDTTKAESDPKNRSKVHLSQPEQVNPDAVDLLLASMAEPASLDDAVGVAASDGKATNTIAPVVLDTIVAGEAE